MVKLLASSEVDRGFIGGVMVKLLASSEVDRGFTGGVMVKLLASSEVDLGFIGDLVVKLLASSEVDRGFEPQSVQTNDNKIGTCYFSNNYPVSNRKCKDWLARNQDKVSE